MNTARNQRLYPHFTSQAHLTQSWQTVSLFALCVAGAAATPAHVSAQSFEGLGVTDDNVMSVVRDISADGLVVVGQSYRPGESFASRATRWTSSEGAVVLFNERSRAIGTNAQGNVVVGDVDVGGTEEPYRWQDGTVTLLGRPDGANFFSSARAVSADGSVIVGTFAGSAIGQRAFRWVEGEGFSDLGSLNPDGLSGSTIASGISDDGSVIIGLSDSQAFRWEDGVMAGLGLLEGATSSIANDISGDGSVIVGSSRYDTGARQAFRWEDGSMVSLGTLPGNFRSQANAVNADGTVIVGNSGDGTLDDPSNRAFRWTATDGMQSIEALLTTAGIDLTGWELREAWAISATGDVIAGNGVHQLTGETAPESFIVYLPLPDDPDGDDPEREDPSDPDGPTSDSAGLTTPARLAQALSNTGVAGRQAQSAVLGGLSQTLTAARHSGGYPMLPNQLASSAPMASTSLDPLTVPRALPDSTWALYAFGAVGRGAVGNSDNTGLDGTIGITTEVGAGWHVGLGITGSRGEFELDFNGKSELDALGGSAFIAYHHPIGVHVLGAAYLTHLKVKNQRRYLNGANIDTAHSDTDGMGYGSAARVGWSFPISASLGVTPFAEVNGSRSELDGYDERGGAFAANVTSQDSWQVVWRSGSEVNYAVNPRVELRASLAWAMRTHGDAGTVSATTLGLSQEVNHGLGDRHWGEGALETIWLATNRARVYAGITGRSGDTDAPNLSATAGLLWSF